MPDNRVQIIIEAFNRTQAAWAELSGQVKKAQGEAVTLYDAYGRPVQRLHEMGTTGAAAGNSLANAGQQGRQAGQATAAGFSQAQASLGSVYRLIMLIVGAGVARKMAELGVDYNKTLETSRLGLAAIVTSMGVVTTSQGRALQGQEKWNASQSISIEAQRELQKIAMVTAATYTELVEVYQGILAPALSAKMTFAETLEIAGLLTNAVKAIGLPVNQIKQEARDLIQGGIQPASSSLAVALNINDAMVKKWREQGVVAQELKKRLEGFVYASREFSDTWEGAWSNFKDVAQRALGEGSKPLFDFIRSEVVKLTNDMTTITRDASGKIVDIQVKPETVARIRELAEDLKKLVQIMETMVKWTGKLAEPLMWGAIALGINKITVAVQGLAAAAGSGTLLNLLNRLPVVAGIVGGIIGGKKLADMESKQAEADAIRSRVATGHEAERMKASGTDFGAMNLQEFGFRELNTVQKQLPTATSDQIASMLRNGIIQVRRAANEAFAEVTIAGDRARKYLEGEQSPFNLKGPSQKSAEEIKKANTEARAALEDGYKQQIEVIRRGETAKVEAIKSGLKDKELLFQQGGISEAELLQEQADAQQAILQESIDATIAAQNRLTEEWNKKQGLYSDPAERSKAHKEYVAAWYKQEEEYVRKSGDLNRALTDEQIRQIELRRQTEATARENSLKLLQEQLAGEKELTRLLLERGRITPLEAEKRAIASEQKSLEADYWNIFGQKSAGGLHQPQIDALDGQLRALEERMANLDQAAPERIYQAGKSTDALEAKREEARISHELAKIEERDKLGETGKSAALQQRQRLLEQLLAKQEAVQVNIAPDDTTAWNSQQQAIDDTRQKIIDAKLVLREFSDDMKGGFREGFRQFIDSAGGDFKRMETLAGETASAMQQAFSDGFFDIMDAKFNSLGKYVLNFLQSVQRAIANAFANHVSSSLISTIGSSLGGLFNSGGASRTFETVTLHDGGLVVPRFHFGGLAGDEVPAILQKGERVLDRDHNALLERFANKTEGTGVNVAINIENQSGQPLDAKVGNMRFDGDGYIIGVVLKALTTSPQFRAAVRG